MLTGAYPFLHPDEEELDRCGRMRAMLPHIISGTYRPLPRVGSNSVFHSAALVLPPQFGLAKPTALQSVLAFRFVLVQGGKSQPTTVFSG